MPLNLFNFVHRCWCPPESIILVDGTYPYSVPPFLQLTNLQRNPQTKLQLSSIFDVPRCRRVERGRTRSAARHYRCRMLRSCYQCWLHSDVDDAEIMLPFYKPLSLGSLDQEIGLLCPHLFTKLPGCRIG